MNTPTKLPSTTIPTVPPTWTSHHDTLLLTTYLTHPLPKTYAPIRTHHAKTPFLPDAWAHSLAKYVIKTFKDSVGWEWSVRDTRRRLKAVVAKYERESGGEGVGEGDLKFDLKFDQDDGENLDEGQMLSMEMLSDKGLSLFQTLNPNSSLRIDNHDPIFPLEQELLQWPDTSAEEGLVPTDADAIDNDERTDNEEEEEENDTNSNATSIDQWATSPVSSKAATTPPVATPSIASVTKSTIDKKYCTPEMRRKWIDPIMTQWNELDTAVSESEEEGDEQTVVEIF